MSDSYSAFRDDVKDYKRLCKLLSTKPKDKDVDYDHLEEMTSSPAIYWKQGTYHADYDNYPEYFL